MTPPRELESARLRFTGPIDDLPAHIEAADLCICPLFAGGGTRMKILEYFAAGKAVVSTPLGAEGLEVTDGVEIALAGRDVFVYRVLSVLGAPAGRRRMGHAGAIISGSSGTAEEKLAAFEEAGMGIARRPKDFVDLMKARV